MRKIEIVSDHHCMHLSTILHAPIFIAKNWNSKDEEIIEVDVSRTKFERIVYSGYQLDVNHDFEIFTFLISRIQQQGTNKIIFTERELLNHLLISGNEKRIIEPIEQRFKRLLKSSIHIHRYALDEYNNKKSIQTLHFNIVKEIDWNKEKKSICVISSAYFGEIGSSLFQKEYINLYTLREITGTNSNYAKCLFLYLKTRDFKSKRFVDHKLTDLQNRITSNVSCIKNKNRFIKQSLILLKKNKLIKDFEMTISKINRIKIVRIFNR